MAINFTYYPTSNRVPGVYVEMDPSQANSATVLQNTLLIGQITITGTAVSNYPILIESKAQLLTLCGKGSMLNAMGSRYLDRDPFGPLYILPIEDEASSVAATGTITITGPATQSGTLNVYVGGLRVRSLASRGDAETAIATALAAAINATENIEVTAVAAAAVVTLTSIGKGDVFNGIDVRTNYLGSAGGEYDVPGVTLTIVPMAGGTGNPGIGGALANLSDQPFDFIITPYTDTSNLDALKGMLADDVGRWSWEQMIYGGAFTAFKGTLGECTTFGNGRNDQHMSIVAYNDSPDPPWIWATEMGAASAASLRVDPGLPLQYINTTLKAPPISSRWTLGERNTLLYDGMSTFRTGDDGTVIVERMATTYQKNAAGATDNSYLDVETLYGLMFVARDLSNYLLTRYARKKLVSDQTMILAGSNCVNALMIRASVISEYRAMESAGYVQNSRTFSQNVIVENAGNGLVKILAPVDLVNQLRQIAILLQFRKS
jgi:phage tail sheath gpL-like